MSLLSHVLEHTAVLELGALLHTSFHRLLSLPGIPDVKFTAVIHIKTFYDVNVTNGIEFTIRIGLNS